LFAAYAGERGQEDPMSFDSQLDATPSSAPIALTLPACRVSATSPTLVRHDSSSPQRVALEEFVRREFLLHFGARIKHFMPDLLALHGKDGSIRSVVGCRAAASERLFLETYTRQPIEEALAARNGFWVPRDRIVEIGSLACRSARGAIEIVRALVPHLLHAGFSWVVFTGADTVMNVFHYLGLSPRPLCSADALLLGDARHDWGSYYDHQPHVMAGRIQDGVFAAHPLAPRRPQ
jgi:hypothetical protein